jgi:hypothetical protein
MTFDQIPLAARLECRGTQYARIVRTDREQVRRHSAAFGIFDAKGREIGHAYYIDRDFHTIDAAGTTLGELSCLDLLLEESFIVYPQSLRDGVKFGPRPTAAYKRFNTLAEAEAYADKVIARAEKAAVKKASA